MSDQSADNYLWDGSGEADEELQYLESLLARYRYEHPPDADEVTEEAEATV